jgi:hypothetical protein
MTFLLNVAFRSSAPILGAVGPRSARHRSAALRHRCCPLR